MAYENLNWSDSLDVRIAGVAEPAVQYHVLEIRGVVGAQRSNSATIEFAGLEIAGSPPTLDNIVTATQAFKNSTELLDHFSNAVVRIYDGDVLVHYGRISSWDANASPDRMQLQSRADSYLFGNPINQVWYNENNYNETQIDLPIVFNPIVDGVAFGNKSNDTAINIPYSFWHSDMPPASGITAPSQWTLAEAVMYILQSRDTAVLKSRTLVQIQAMLGGAEPIPRNVEIKKGSFLPEALQRLLEPHGYEFKFSPIEDGTPAAPDSWYELTIWKRELGIDAIDPTEFYLDKAGFYSSNVLGGNIKIDIADHAATSIKIIGDPERREGTFLLYPAWLAADETDDPELLSIGGGPNNAWLA